MNPKRLVRWVLWTLAGLLVLLFLLPVFLSPTTVGAVIRCLPFGWWKFLQRNLPQTTWNWSLIITGIVCSIIIVVLAHGMLGMLFRQLYASRQPGQPRRRWRWRWTLGLYAVVWVLFGIAFGAAGVWRHTTWLLNDERPWYRAAGSFYLAVNRAESEVMQALLDSRGDLEKAQQNLLHYASHQGRQPLVAEEVNVLFYGDQSNQVMAYLIIPRNQEGEHNTKFLASLHETNILFKPITELQRTIAELDAKYPPRAARSQPER